MLLDVSKSFQKNSLSKNEEPHTKLAGVHKTPEPIIRSFDPGAIARTGYEGLHGPAQNVGDDLDKQLTNINLTSGDDRHKSSKHGISTDRLWAEILA